MLQHGTLVGWVSLAQPILRGYDEETTADVTVAVTQLKYWLAILGAIIRSPESYRPGDQSTSCAARVSEGMIFGPEDALARNRA